MCVGVCGCVMGVPPPSFSANYIYIIKYYLNGAVPVTIKKSKYRPVGTSVVLVNYNFN